MTDEAATTTLYVSWGGTGRSASLRAAFGQAKAAEGPLVYLAVLDDETFGDVDEDLLEAAVEELEWLLDAQIDMTRTQVNAGDLPVRVIVRQGTVEEQVVAVAETLGDVDILLGAPIPQDESSTIPELIQTVEQATGRQVKVVDSGGPAD